MAAKHLKMSWQQVLRNVGGLVKQGGPLYPEPAWYKAALSVPPMTFGKQERPPEIVLPEDEHVQGFYRMFPEEPKVPEELEELANAEVLGHKLRKKAKKLQGPEGARSRPNYRVAPARIFAHRVLDMLEENYSLQEAYKYAAEEHKWRSEAEKGQKTVHLGLRRLRSTRTGVESVLEDDVRHQVRGEGGETQALGAENSSSDLRR